MSGNNNTYRGDIISQIPKLEINEPPQAGYSLSASANPETAFPTPSPWYNPRRWSTRMKVCVGIGLLCALIVILGSVLGADIHKYPNYGALNYRLVDTYSGHSFFDHFNYYSDVDPTGGFVQYVERDTAQMLNLTFAIDTSVVVKVDTTTQAVEGRKSVRLESKNSFDNGLFIFDIIHTPYGCGTWPALWLTDTYNWPLNGEIDILETTNKATEGNVITLHSTDGCNMHGKRKQTGTPLFVTCDDDHGNAGCSVQGNPNTYGEEMNENGGGIYAVELRKAGIRAWFFPRHSILYDISDMKSSTSPDPSSWGTPLADFPNTHCDIPSHFSNQSIIVNIDLCGEMGAQPQLYNDLYNCPGKCEEFVAHHPESFVQAYWEFRKFRIYQAV